MFRKKRMYRYEKVKGHEYKGTIDALDPRGILSRNTTSVGSSEFGCGQTQDPLSGGHAGPLKGRAENLGLSRSIEACDAPARFDVQPMEIELQPVEVASRDPVVGRPQEQECHRGRP